MKTLALALIVVTSFGAGFAFDRWLHRPIRAAGFVLRQVSTETSPVPIPPCMINCEPASGEDEASGDAEPESKCYTDGSVPCAAPGRAVFKLRPWIGPCPFDPLRNERCQSEI